MNGREHTSSCPVYITPQERVTSSIFCAVTVARFALCGKFNKSAIEVLMLRSLFPTYGAALMMNEMGLLCHTRKRHLKTLLSKGTPGCTGIKRYTCLSQIKRTAEDNNWSVLDEKKIKRAHRYA